MTRRPPQKTHASTATIHLRQALCKRRRDRGISPSGSLVSCAHGCVGSCVLILVVALQGAFAEHQAMFQKLSMKRRLHIVQVRTPEDLKKCDALVIPGGGEVARFSAVSSQSFNWSCARSESTTIALLARLAGLLQPLRDFVKSRPVWGTCAGAILLAQAVEGMKKGGQELLGGISVTIMRNGFGSQVCCSALGLTQTTNEHLSGRVFRGATGRARASRS